MTVFKEDLVKIQKLLLKIPKGKVTTYGRLAKAIGKPRAYRYAGTLLGKNPCPNKYPCYKVVKSNGEVGHYSGVGGPKEKIRRLMLDNVIIEKGRVINFTRCSFDKL